jgi:hypothetical protein
MYPRCAVPHRLRLWSIEGLSLSGLGRDLEGLGGAWGETGLGKALGKLGKMCEVYKMLFEVLFFICYFMFT